MNVQDEQAEKWFVIRIDGKEQLIEVKPGLKIEIEYPEHRMTKVVEGSQSFGFKKRKSLTFAFTR